MNSEHRFQTVIESARGGGAYVRIPFDVEKVFGKKRVPIRAAFDGVEYRGTVVRMGEAGYILGVLKEIRSKIGKDVGDEVEVVLEEDIDERKVDMPEDLIKAMEEEPTAKAAYERLSYTHQKEIVKAILEAKRAETRQARVARTMERLKEN
jgi:hypothetical protein